MTIMNKWPESKPAKDGTYLVCHLANEGEWVVQFTWFVKDNPDGFQWGCGEVLYWTEVEIPRSPENDFR